MRKFFYKPKHKAGPAGACPKGLEHDWIQRLVFIPDEETEKYDMCTKCGWTK